VTLINSTLKYEYEGNAFTSYIIPISGLVRGYLILVALHPFRIIVSINFHDPILHILQTPSLYQKGIKTRINSKNMRYLKLVVPKEKEILL
jgi:hypothetical protein